LELIKKYRVRRNGDRGQVVSIPLVFIEEQKIKAGDVIRFYADDGKLILVPEKTQEVVK